MRSTPGVDLIKLFWHKFTESFFASSTILSTETILLHLNEKMKTLSITILSVLCHYAEHYYAECRYAECRGAAVATGSLL
jgi:hypothetical protein